MLTLYTPINRIARGLDIFDRVFAEALGRGVEERAADGFGAFPLDLRETGEAYVLRAELPGFAKEGVEIGLDDGVLTISARKKAEERREGETWLLNERAWGEFRRSIRLPGRLSGEAKAAYDNGVLIVTVLKAEDAKPRKIAINS
ncbi:MAG: Hsp20/alpha crystallin family protein [Thermodesulfobacteriota bacterium]